MKMKTRNKENVSQEPPVFTFDLSDSREDTEGEQRLFNAFLKEQGLDNPLYSFTGVDGERSKKILQQGVDSVRRKMLFSFTLDQALNIPEYLTGERTHPLEYALDFEEPMILVYDQTKLQSASGIAEYSLREGHTYRDALVAVINVKIK